MRGRVQPSRGLITGTPASTKGGIARSNGKTVDRRDGRDLAIAYRDGITTCRSASRERCINHGSLAFKSEKSIREVVREKGLDRRRHASLPFALGKERDAQQHPPPGQGRTDRVSLSAAGPATQPQPDRRTA